MTDALPNSETAPADHNDGGRAIEIDLYCLECGYNLRGLSGDPLRCPECAFENPIREVTIPADRIRGQLRHMESVPAFSVLALLFLLPALVATIVTLLRGRTHGLEHSVTTVIIASLAWIVSVAVFRFSCLARPGWLAALIRYQLVGVVLAAIITCIFWYGAQFVERNTWGRNQPLGDTWLGIAVPLGLTAIFVGIVWGLRPVHRWLRAPMDQLRRHVAVKIARDRIREEMRHRRGWGRR